MPRPARWKAALAVTSAAVTALGAGGLVLAKVATATQPMAATTWVNLRSGPSTSKAPVGVLAPAEVVEATGRSQGGWVEVRTRTGAAGWVFTSYLRATATSAPNSGQPATTPQRPATAPAASGTATTTAGVNVRTGPGTSNPSVAVAARGTTLPTTGKTSGGWTEVIHAGAARWIASSYLRAGSAPVSASPVTGQVRTTAGLYLRTGGDASAPSTGVLPGNSVVDTTGRTTAAYTEIIFRGENRWIATRYTTAATTAPTAPAAPQASGTVRVTVGELYVRATAAPNGAIVATVTRGTELATTGVVQGDRLQVIHAGAPRWVFAAYTSAGAATPAAANPPAASNLASTVSISGYDRLNAHARSVVDRVREAWPQVRTIGGWRASSSFSSDHPNGRAVDVMIPNWSSAGGIDLGDRIARDFQQNASRYRVSYIIWRQKIWNASFPERGWRSMEDRGDATANHFDHVHVSVQP